MAMRVGERALDDLGEQAVALGGRRRLLRDERALAAHPMRHILTNVLGAREHAEIHVSERKLRGGETLLLCTDGVHGVVDDRTLSAALAAGGPPEAIARAIVASAMNAGTRDNITALVVRCDGGGGDGRA